MTTFSEKIIHQLSWDLMNVTEVSLLPDTPASPFTSFRVNWKTRGNKNTFLVEHESKSNVALQWSIRWSGYQLYFESLDELITYCNCRTRNGFDLA